MQRDGMAAAAAAVFMWAQPARILLVDDHPVVIEGLEKIIQAETDFEVCGSAGEAETVIRLVETAKPDVVIVDLSLRDGDGMTLIRSLSVLHPQLPVIVFSMHEESLRGEEALEAGARGYVMKLASQGTLPAAIRQVLKGGMWFGERTMSRRRAAVSDAAAAGGTTSIGFLSPDESRVAFLLGQGLSVQWIARELHTSIRRIRAMLETARVKLKFKTTAEIARHAVLLSKPRGVEISHFKRESNHFSGE